MATSYLGESGSFILVVGKFIFERAKEEQKLEANPLARRQLSAAKIAPLLICISCVPTGSRWRFLGSRIE